MLRFIGILVLAAIMGYVAYNSIETVKEVSKQRHALLTNVDV